MNFLNDFLDLCGQQQEPLRALAFRNKGRRPFVNPAGAQLALPLGQSRAKGSNSARRGLDLQLVCFALRNTLTLIITVFCVFVAI